MEFVSFSGSHVKPALSCLWRIHSNDFTPPKLPDGAEQQMIQNEADISCLATMNVHDDPDSIKMKKR